MSQHLNDPSSDAWGLPTTDVAVKGCDMAPGRLTQRDAYSTFGFDTADLCWPKIKYQGCIELRVIS